MSKKKRWTLRVYMPEVKRVRNYSSTIYLAPLIKRKVPEWLNPDSEPAPKNHAFNKTRKNKIVMGKRNAWPLPKSKGNRF